MYFKDRSYEAIQEAANNYVDPIQEESLDEHVQEYDGDEGIIDREALLETMLIDLISQMSDDQRRVYMESDEFQNLLEAGIAGRRSVVRLSRQDDLSRRVNLASIQMAKEKGDSDWEALRRNRMNERRLLDRIYQKYGNKVRRDAIQAQKNLVKLSPKAFSMTKAIR